MEYKTRFEVVGSALRVSYKHQGQNIWEAARSYSISGIKYILDYKEEYVYVHFSGVGQLGSALGHGQNSRTEVIFHGHASYLEIPNGSPNSVTKMNWIESNIVENVNSSSSGTINAAITNLPLDVNVIGDNVPFSVIPREIIVKNFSAGVASLDTDKALIAVFQNRSDTEILRIRDTNIGGDWIEIPPLTTHIETYHVVNHIIVPPCGIYDYEANGDFSFILYNRLFY